MQLLDTLLDVQVGYKIHVPSRDCASCFKNAGGGHLLLPRSYSGHSAGQGCLLWYCSGCFARFSGYFEIEIITGIFIRLHLVSAHSRWKTSSPNVHQSPSSGQSTEIQDLKGLLLWRRTREIGQQVPSSFRWLVWRSQICRNEWCLRKSAFLWIQHSGRPSVSHLGGGGQQCGASLQFIAAICFLQVWWDGRCHSKISLCSQPTSAGNNMFPTKSSMGCWYRTPTQEALQRFARTHSGFPRANSITSELCCERSKAVNP